MLKKIWWCIEDRIQFEHMCLVGFGLTAAMRLYHEHSVSPWFVSLAELYIVLSTACILSTVFVKKRNKTLLIFAWSAFSSGMLVFAIVGPVPWVYYPAAFGAFLKVRWLFHGRWFR